MQERNKRFSYRNLGTLLVLFIIFISAALLSPTRVNAATPKWKTAYNKILKNWRLVEQYEDMSYLKMYFNPQYFGSQYKFNRYFTYDVDKNGTPELFLHSTSMGLTEVMTYNKKLISLGYYDIARINEKTKEIIVHGHWHGAGGSYENEWSVYKVNKKSSSLKYYIDIMPNGTNGSQRVSVYNGKWKLLSTRKSYYDRIYKNHIKNATPINQFKKYKLTDKKGLR